MTAMRAFDVGLSVKDVGELFAGLIAAVGRVLASPFKETGRVAVGDPETPSNV